jgi:5,10-methylenetetrahydromethanopterin reductase
VLISVALPPGRRIVEYAQAAEQAGAHRIWLYDSPAVYSDIWVALARLAEHTSLRLGTSVMVPSLRNPMVTAAAIATIEDLAPGRLTVAMGTGYTARRALGQKPMTWTALAAVVTQVRDLLAGKTVEIDGKPSAMLHGTEWAPQRPIGTPLWAAPQGPKGFRIARELGVDGVVLTGIPEPEFRQWESAALLVYGTVLEPGEDHTIARVIDAVGPWFAASYHACSDMYPELLDHIAGGREWRSAVGQLAPQDSSHLEVHRGHLTEMNQADRAGIAAAGPALLEFGWTGTPSTVQDKVHDAAQAGITEIIYSPTGPGITREIDAFLKACQ